MPSSPIPRFLSNDGYDGLLRKGARLVAAARRDLHLPVPVGLEDDGVPRGGLDTIGYDADALDALAAEAGDVADLLTDDERVGDLVDATAAKNRLAARLRAQIAYIVARAVSYYGADSRFVRRYGIHKLSKMTDDDLWQAAKRTHRVATAQLSALTVKGLTAAALLTLRTDTRAFDAARDAQDDARMAREIATYERVRAANAYYVKLLALLATAYTHFAPYDEARANDYVWHPAPRA